MGLGICGSMILSQCGGQKVQSLLVATRICSFVPVIDYSYLCCVCQPLGDIRDIREKRMKSEFLATKKKNQLVFFSLGIFKFLVLFVFLTSVVDWTGCLLDGYISRMPLSFKLLSIDT